MKRKRRIQTKLTDEKRLAFNAMRVAGHADELRKVHIVEDSLVKRIALDLMRFRDKRAPSEYIIIQDVINSTNLPEIKFQEKAEVISFAGTPEVKTRTQRLISNSSEIIQKLLTAFELIFPGCLNVTVKLLHSFPGDTEQVTHTDFNYNSIIKRVRSLKAFHYSALVAIQLDSILLMGVRREVINIPLNGMIFWRGNCPHAGGGYQISNSRIFISISSAFCPLSSDVYIIK